MSRKPTLISSRVYLSGMVLLLLLATGLRIFTLEADAPLDVSPTQELALDGPVTVAAARDRAIFGSWDPYPGPLQPYRYYPAMNWLAFPFFKLLGTGFWQANFISVVTGLLSVALIAGFARQQFGKRVALLSALFVATSYIYVIYNRDPMAYTTATCGLTLSLFCWGRGLRRPLWFFVSGAVMTFNALFIKLPGIAFLPAALIGFVVLIWPQRKTLKLSSFVPSLLFGFGALVVGLSWLAFIYLPDARQVSQAYYVRTFSPSYSLLDNIRFAVQSMLFFGVEFGFNLRMLPLFALSYAFVFFRLAQLLGRNRPKLPAGEMVALTLMLSTVLMLFFSGIRPLRFQILLIPSMALLAAVALDRWLRRAKAPLAESFGLTYPVFVLLGLTYFSYQVAAALLMLYRMIRYASGPVSDDVALDIGILYTILSIALIVAVFGTMLFVWRVVRVRRPYLTLPCYRRRLMIGLVLVVLATGSELTQYLSWARDPQFSIVMASREAGKEYDASSTVFGGTYAYTLALENELPAVWFFSATPDDVRLAAGVTHFARSYDAGDAAELEAIEADRPCAGTHILRGYLVKICETED